MNYSSSEKTDSSLLRGIHGGDDAAAQALFERYIDKLEFLTNRQLAKELRGRIDTDDVTQSIFRTLFRRLHEGQYSVPKGDSIWQLLVTIALNKVRAIGKHHRRGKRDIRRNSSAEIESTVHLNAHDDDGALAMLQLTIDELLEGLTDEKRQMVELRIEGNDLETIAKQTGRSKRSVERVLQGFRKRLKDVLTDE